MPHVPSRIAVTIVAILPLSAAADTKPPQAQYWVDVATNNSSIPGMSGGLSGIVGSMMGVGGGPRNRSTSGSIRATRSPRRPRPRMTFRPL